MAELRRYTAAFGDIPQDARKILMYSKLLDRAHRRYRSAMRDLAAVHKVGELRNQINIATGPQQIVNER